MTNKLQETLEVIIYGEIKHGFRGSSDITDEDIKRHKIYMDFYGEFLAKDSYLSKLLAKELLNSKLIKIEKSDDK